MSVGIKILDILTASAVVEGITVCRILNFQGFTACVEIVVDAF